MAQEEDERKTEGVIRAIEDGANAVDIGRIEAVMWLDDARFSEIEESVAEPFGAPTVHEIHTWLRENATPGDNVRYSDLSVHLLAPTVAYATARQDSSLDGTTTSWVTFIVLKQGDRWGLIHSHTSLMREAEGAGEEDETA